MASQEIEALAGALARLPGLGPRSARRAVLWLVKRRETALVHLLDALNAVRAKVGATVNRLDVADARLSEYEGTALKVLSDNEDADIAKAMIDFSIQQAAMQAGLKAGATIVQNSLLDFLR